MSRQRIFYLFSEYSTEQLLVKKSKHAISEHLMKPPFRVIAHLGNLRQRLVINHTDEHQSDTKTQVL